MKNFYRNFLCILLILISIAGIVLMSLNLAGILDDNLNDISPTVSDGLTQDDPEKLDETIMTFQSDYDGVLYLRNENFGQYNDSKRRFDYASVYKNKMSYSPLTYFAKKVSDLNEKVYSLTINVDKAFRKKMIPEYSTWANEQDFGSELTDCYVKENRKSQNDTFSFYPEPVADDKTSLDIIRSLPFGNDTIEKEEEEYSKYVKKNYLSIDQTMKADLIQYMDENEINLESPTFIFDVKNYLQNFSYDPSAIIPKNEKKPLLYFLTVNKAGICNNFAAASSMMYRANGIPSRVVAGALCYSRKGEISEVKRKALHAWTEVYIDGCGWMKIDTTASMRCEDLGYDDIPAIPDEPDIPDQPDKPDEPEKPETKKIQFKFSVSDVLYEYNGTYQKPQIEDYLALDSICEYSSKTGEGEEFPLVSNDLMTNIRHYLKENETFNLKFNKDANLLFGETFLASMIFITDDTGKDVTSNYRLVVKWNEFSEINASQLSSIEYTKEFCVKERSIHLKSNSGGYMVGQKVEYYLEDDGSERLVPGDRIECQFTLPETFDESNENFEHMGNNTFTVRIYNEEGDDVTTRYSIEYEYGTIDVVEGTENGL